jgi:hypothetical protein
MAWLSRVNFIASDTLSFTDVNNLGNDIRAWGDNVNGGGYTLSNVIVSASAGTMPTVTGGSAAGSTLTLRSTSGAGTTDAIIFQTGSQVERARITTAGRFGLATNSPDLALHVVGTQGGPATSGTVPTGTARFVTVNSAMDIGSRSNGNTWMQVTDRSNLALSYNLELQPNGGNVGISAATPVAAKLEVVTANDTTSGAPVSAYDNKFVLVGPGSASSSGNLFFSWNSTNNVGFIGALAPGVAWRNLVLNADGGNVCIGGNGTRATTAGSKALQIFNGTAPVGTLTNGASFYVTSGEMRVMDASGNATLLSPHDKTTNEWIYDSAHTPTGRRLRIDVERLLRFVNAHFGLDCISEFTEKAQ